MTTAPKNIHDLRKMKIEDALKLLEDTAKESKSDLKSILEEKYESVEAAIESILGVSPKEFFMKAKDRIESAAEESQNYVKQTAKDVDANVHNNPWPYIGGGVAVGLIAGYLVGRK